MDQIISTTRLQRKNGRRQLNNQRVQAHHLFSQRGLIVCISVH